MTISMAIKERDGEGVIQTIYGSMHLSQVLGSRGLL